MAGALLGFCPPSSQPSLLPWLEPPCCSRRGLAPALARRGSYGARPSLRPSMAVPCAPEFCSVPFAAPLRSSWCSSSDSVLRTAAFHLPAQNLRSLCEMPSAARLARPSLARLAPCCSPAEFLSRVRTRPLTPSHVFFFPARISSAAVL